MGTCIILSAVGVVFILSSLGAATHPTFQVRSLGQRAQVSCSQLQDCPEPSLRDCLLRAPSSFLLALSPLMAVRGFDDPDQWAALPQYCLHLVFWMLALLSLIFLIFFFLLLVPFSSPRSMH